MEADAIVIAGVPRQQGRSAYTMADHYVAVSRARMLLVEIVDLSRT